MRFHKTLIAGAAALAVTASGLATPVKADEIVISAVSPTSDDYAFAVVWSNLLIKAGSKHKMTVVDNGTAGGVRKLAQGKVDIAMIGAPHFKDATQKAGKFKKDPDALVAKYKNMKALFALQTAAAQYVFKADQNVKTFSDFKGKKFSIGRPGGNGGRVTQTMLKVHGIDMEKETGGVYMKYAPALDQMANGSMDGAFVFGGIPHAAIDNASRKMELKFASPEPEKMAEFRKSITNGEFYVLKHIPAETIEKAYEGRVKANGDQYFWAFPFMWVVHDTMPEDVAYDLTKTVWENVAEVNKTSLALSLIKREVAIEGLSVDLHPGAAKYFKEIGLLK